MLVVRPGAGVLVHAPCLGLELDHPRHGAVEERAVVRDEHDARAQAAQKALEALEPGEVEIVRRLVEAEDVEAGQQDRGERGAGRLAAGEVGRPRRRRGPRARPRPAPPQPARSKSPPPRARKRSRASACASASSGSAPSRAPSASSSSPAAPTPVRRAEVGEHRLAGPRARAPAAGSRPARAHDPAAVRLLDAREERGAGSTCRCRSGRRSPTRSPGRRSSDTRSSTWTAPKLFEISRAASVPGTDGPPSVERAKRVRYAT